MAAIRDRHGAIAERVAQREGEIGDLLQAPEETDVEILPASEVSDGPEGEEAIAKIRESVTDEAVAAQMGEAASGPPSPPSGPPVSPPATPQGAPTTPATTDEGGTR